MPGSDPNKASQTLVRLRIRQAASDPGYRKGPGLDGAHAGMGLILRDASNSVQAMFCRIARCVKREISGAVIDDDAQLTGFTQI